MNRVLRHLIPLLASPIVAFLLLFFMPRQGSDFAYYLSLGFALVTLLLTSTLSWTIPPLKNYKLAVQCIVLAAFLFTDPSLWGIQGFGPLWILFGAMSIFSIENKKQVISSSIVFLAAFVLAFFPFLRFLAYAFLALISFIYAFLAKETDDFCIDLSVGLFFFIAAFGYLPEKGGISYANSQSLLSLTIGINVYLFRSLWGIRKRNIDLARKELTLSNIEEKALKEEIQPHFLLNALNNVRVAYHDSIEKGNAQLGELRNLEERIYATFDSSFIPLGDEIGIIKALIGLYNVDRATNVTLNIDIEDATLPIPPMLLEPLVENSLQHSGILQQEGGEISIKQREEYGFAFITISDNGRGQPLPSNSRGIGLSNVMKRVSLLDNGHMSIDSSEEGTSIEIRFVPEREEGDFFSVFDTAIE